MIFNRQLTRQEERRLAMIVVAIAGVLFLAYCIFAPRALTNADREHARCEEQWSNRSGFAVVYGDSLPPHASYVEECATRGEK